MKFFDNLKSKLVKYANETIIVGGDFNGVFTPNDKSGGCPIEKKGAVVQAINFVISVKFWI